MLCDGNPDPLNTRDLNTFVNLWRDDKEYKPFPVVLSEGENTLKVKIDQNFCNDVLKLEFNCVYYSREETVSQLFLMMYWH